MSRQTESFPDVSLHFVGGEGVLLDRSRQRLYALNASAAVIWSCLKQGKSRAETAELLSRQLSLPADEAAAFVADALRQYAAMSRAGNSTPAGILQLATAAASADRPRAPRPGAVPAAVRHYRLVDTTFRVRFGSAALLATIRPLLDHNATAARTTEVVDIVVAVEETEVTAFTGGRIIGQCAALEEAAVMVRACLLELAITGSGGFCAIHACALRRDGGALLLPGEAESGKSTLSAALAGRDFEMLSDDTALIAGEPPAARCIPAGICLKPGSYEVLDSGYPQLHERTEWRRPDGKRARYLMPRQDITWAEPDAAAEVRWIVFPAYRPAGSTALSPLRPQEALARLLPGLYALSGTLDDATLGRLVAWIERVDCAELSVSSLEIATALLDDYCR